MSLLAFLLLLTTAIVAGRAFRGLIGRPEDSLWFRTTSYLVVGLLLLHAAMAWLDLAGVAWHPLAILLVVAIGALAARRLARRASSSGEETVAAAWTLGWASYAGGALVLFFALLAASERIAFPDFVYHWGIKGHRYFLARAIDYEFLTAEWNLVAHRDYPQLVPELYALQSMIAGRFSEPALLLWSAVFFAALLVAAREALAAWAVRIDLARVTFVVLALAICTFAVGHQMAGSVDWIVALALLAALPVLARAPSAAGDLLLGALAALVASAKLEGLTLAALLVAAGGWRRLTSVGAVSDASGRGAAVGRVAAGEPVPIARRLRSTLAALPRLGVPTLIAIAPWVVQGLRHDLFRDPQSGAFDAERAPAIAAAVWRTLLRPEWHLVPFVLVLLPLLLVRRETRLAGAIVALQLGGYLLRYFTAAFDYEFSILSSFPRLMFHVVPAVVVGLAVVADRWARAPAPSRAGTVASGV